MQLYVKLNLDFTLLRQQKGWLLQQEAPEAEGIIQMLDAIQDAAVAADVATEEEVFGKDVQALCAEAGYTVTRSTFHGYYWESQFGDASTDFPTETEAWADCYRSNLEKRQAASQGNHANQNQ